MFICQPNIGFFFLNPIFVSAKIQQLSDFSKILRNYQFGLNKFFLNIIGISLWLSVKLFGEVLSVFR